MPIQKLQKVHLKDAVYNQMMELIASGEWKSGEKIPSENKLTAMFNVSRITIREAIQKLSSLGLLESVHGSGTYVCDYDGSQALNAMIPSLVLNDNHISSMLEFRRIIEGSSAYYAALRATKEDIAALKENIEKMRGYMDDIDNRIILDIDFHIQIAKATKNPIIVHTTEVLRNDWLTCMRQIVRMMGSSKAIKYHTLLLEAIADHQPDRAKAIMDEHIDSTISAMNKTIQ